VLHFVVMCGKRGHLSNSRPTATLLDRSYAVFDGLRQAVKDNDHLADPNSGEVKIGTTAPLAASFVFSVIDRLSRRHPDIVFNVTVEYGGIEAAVWERRIELAIIRNLGALSDERLDFRPLFESPYVVAAGVQNPWTKRRRVRLAELSDELWALPAAAEAFGPFVEEAFRADGLPMPRGTVVTSTLEMRANLAGRYLTIFPEFWLRVPQPHPFIKNLQVELATTGGAVGLAWVKGRTMSPVASHFVQTAEDIARVICAFRALHY
jgi:DNA-binding transcriptional LysR family regulator